jgi:hypothetical protein
MRFLVALSSGAALQPPQHCIGNADKRERREVSF